MFTTAVVRKVIRDIQEARHFYITCRPIHIVSIENHLDPIITK